MKITRAALSIITFFLPALTFAQSFSAQTDKRMVGLSESFDLQLELSDLKAKGSPDFSELQNNFQIEGQRQSSMTKFINGKSSSSTFWDLTLLPTQLGPQVIPAISINSNSGTIKTNPIAIEVKEEPVPSSHLTQGRRILLRARVNKTAPYKDEPVLVTFELTTRQTLRNVEIGDLKVKDAVVEREGDPKKQTKIINGREVRSLIISYLVTPLKEGVLNVPALIIRGEVPQDRSRATSHSQLDPWGDDNDGPFSQMQKMTQKMMASFGQDDDFFGNFSPMRPIAVSSLPISLKVLSSVPGVTPWFPMSNLTLSESWSGEVKVGEPLTRIISTHATGLAASQLPGFEDQLSSGTDYKVYNDQPVLSQKIASGEVQSFRKDTLTIIPQREGDLRFPAIKLSWWDTKTHARRIAILPEKVLHVLPGSIRMATSTLVGEDNTLSQPPSTLKASLQPENFIQDHWPLLALLLLASIIGYFLFRLYKQGGKLSVTTQNEKSDSIPVMRKADLSHCATVHDIFIFLQKFSQSRWDLKPNSPLSKIYSIAELKLEDFNPQQAKDIFQRLEKALYAQTPTDVPKLKSEIAEIIFKNDRVSKNNNTTGVLPELNPS